MAKDLERLLKQRKWTGEEAGQIYLYSTANDITHSRRGEETEPVVEQEIFDKITKTFSFNQKETIKFNFYLHLDRCITSIEQLFRYYEQVFYRYITASMLILNQIEAAQRLMEKIEAIKIAAQEKSFLESELMTARCVADDNSPVAKSCRALLSDNTKNIKASVSFFNAINFTYKNLFEHLDFPQMKRLLIDTNEYEKEIDDFNSARESLLESESLETTTKFSEFCQRIDFEKLKPAEEDIDRMTETLSLNEDKYATLLDGIQDFIIDLGNIVLLRNGEAHE